MKLQAVFACVLLFTGMATAQKKGIKPRADASAYPASVQAEALTFGAAQLSPQQVKNTFASPDLSRNYLVVEIGVFPKRSSFQLDPDNFSVAIEGTKTVFRAASPQAIAAVLQKPGGRDVTLYPAANIGYESGHDIYGQPRGGLTTGVGVGVGVDPKPQRSDADRKVIETELRDKSLPSGSFDKPVAGYLYFPVSGDRNGKYILEYSDGSASLNLPLGEREK